MGRLTEAFGFLHCKPAHFVPLWIKANICTLTPSEELYSMRRKYLGSKLSEKRLAITKELEKRRKKVEAEEYIYDLEAMELGLITKKEFEAKHGEL